MTNRLVIIQTVAAMARVKFGRYRVVSEVDRMATVLLYCQESEIQRL
ncbi:MAG: hypothetical protein ACYS3N_11855 [Planctomycetota bacterium]